MSYFNMYPTNSKNELLRKHYNSSRNNKNLVINDLLYILSDYYKIIKISKEALHLVIDEAVSNAMKHGNKWNSDKFIKIVIFILENSLHITIEDEGFGFNFRKKLFEIKKQAFLKKIGFGLILISELSKAIWSNKGKKLELIIDIEEKND